MDDALNHDKHCQSLLEVRRSNAMTSINNTPSHAPTAVIADYLRGSISVSYLVGLVWSGRVIVIASALAGLVYGAYTVNQGGPRFMAVMRVSPAETDNLGGGGDAVGLLAGLTGQSGAVVVPKFTQFLDAIGSVSVANELDRKYSMLCRAYSGECDVASRKWSRHIGVREWFSGVMARLSGLPNPNGPRTTLDLAAYTLGAVAKQEDKRNSIVTLTYTHSKPKFAEEFLSLVVQETNNHIRRQNRDNQRRYVDYLATATAKSANVEQRQALGTLLLQQERQLMMTEVDGPYAAQILDGPNVLPVNTALKTLAVFTLISTILGIAIAVSRNLVPRRWRFWQ
jgi:hypothetical protein